MKIQSRVSVIIVLVVFALIPTLSFAQITSEGKVSSITYSDGSQDSIYVFCGQKGDTNGSLTASSSDESASFEWMKYNDQSREFELFPGGSSGVTISTIFNLQDGCYRVNITTTSGVKTSSTAWVFNNYIETTADITDSNCNSFKLTGTAEPQRLTYVDLPSKETRYINKDLKIKWSDGSTFINRTIYDTPTKNTDYTLEVTDRFGCTSNTAMVTYNSIVTKASFTYVLEDQSRSHPQKIEAPLSVTFTNTSDNDDADQYEWFIFKDIDVITQEALANPGKVIDSILVKIYGFGPIIYVFENPGTYNVKLVSKNNTCSDTVYIDKYIVIDASFIEAPNVFTPGNADGLNMNDNFIVRFFSMQSVKISIFNRWGKVLHVWESNDVRGFGPTHDSVPQSVWDGKVGGKLATPGVYYYVVEGMGRDGKRRTANGFVHLFRGK